MKLRSTLLRSVLTLIAIAAASPATGQMMIRAGEDGSDIVFLRELGVIAATEDGSGEVRLILVMPQPRDVALEEDDLVMMVDGKRIREIATLRDAYEAAAVGDVIKLGVRRGEERFLTSFEKKDPDEMEQGGGRMVVMHGPGPDFDDLQPVEEFGVILGEKDGQVVVAMPLPVGESAFEPDDVVTSLNGQAVDSLAGFRKIYDSLAIGDDVAVVVRREDAEVEATRAKAEGGKIRMQVGH
jgi:S1-C subfamily serine protease